MGVASKGGNREVPQKAIAVMQKLEMRAWATVVAALGSDSRCILIVEPVILMHVV